MCQPVLGLNKFWSLRPYVYIFYCYFDHPPRCLIDHVVGFGVLSHISQSAGGEFAYRQRNNFVCRNNLTCRPDSKQRVNASKHPPICQNHGIKLLWYAEIKISFIASRDKTRLRFDMCETSNKPSTEGCSTVVL